MEQVKGSNNKKYDILLINQGEIEGVNIGGILMLPKDGTKTQKLLTMFQFDRYQSTIKDLETGEDRQVKTIADSAQRIVVDNNINLIIEGLEIDGQVVLLPLLPNDKRVQETLRPDTQTVSTDALQRECFTELTPDNPYYRIDNQIAKMIEFVTNQYNLEQKTNIFGHSAMGLPAMRYAMLQPQTIDNLIIGGNADEIPTPFGKNGPNLPYPFGTKDFEKLFGKEFDMESFSNISFKYYIGEYEHLDPNLDGIRDDNYGTRRDGKPGTGQNFAPQEIAELYKETYNENYKSDYNLSTYERLMHVLEQYEQEGLDMTYMIYDQDCHTPIKAEDLRNAQFEGGTNFQKEGSKLVAKLLAKIKELEEYATSEPATPAKEEYAKATEKIYYNKGGNDRENRVEALKQLETEYGRTKTISIKSIVANAITQGIATEHVKQSDVVEQHKTNENQIEGETKDE